MIGKVEIRDHQELTKAIQDTIKDHGETLTSFCEASEVSQGTIYRIMNGQKNVLLSVMARLEAFTGYRN